MDFKTFVDILASFAAIVAIVSVMVKWYQSSRKPLKIVRVVVHKTAEDMTFILVTKNRQPYPVTTKRIDCYKRKIFEVQKKVGGEPEYSERLSSREMLFMGRSDFEVPANTNTDLRIKVPGTADIPNRLLFSMDTSHGYHELWCDEISVLEVGRTEVYRVDYMDEYKSKVAAKVMYHWRLVQELTRRCSRRLRRS